MICYLFCIRLYYDYMYKLHYCLGQGTSRGHQKLKGREEKERLKRLR